MILASFRGAFASGTDPRLVGDARLAYIDRVAVTVLDIGDWYRAVTVLGTVADIRDDDGLADIDRLSVRYRGTPYWNRERKRVSAFIQPERWHEHS